MEDKVIQNTDNRFFSLDFSIKLIHYRNDVLQNTLLFELEPYVEE